jgi:hypothetical protein
LFAFAIALLAQPHGASLGVEVATTQVQRAFAAGARLEVEPENQQVQVGVTAGGAHGVDQLGQLVVIQRSTPAADPPGLCQCRGRVHRDQPRVRGAAKQRPHGGHAAFPRRPSGAAGTTPLGAGDGIVDDRGQVPHGDFHEPGDPVAARRTFGL